MSEYADDILYPEWSQQWPGTTPAPLPTRLVTHADLGGTCNDRSRPGRPYRTYHNVYRVHLVHPGDSDDYWYLDFKQPHLLVCQFCTWVTGEERSALLWEMAQLYATEDAPAFRWEPGSREG